MYVVGQHDGGGGGIHVLSGCTHNCDDAQV